jgi:hypothetical protein
MARKSAVLIAAAAALVLALPAIANAGVIQDKGGKKLLVGTILEGSSFATKIKVPYGGGGMDCGPGALPFENKLSSNGSGAFTTVSLGSKTSECKTFSGKIAPIAGFAVPNLKSSAAGSGTMDIQFVVILLIGECHYEATALPFTYLAGSSQFSFSGTLKAVPLAICDPASITGTFKLASGGTPVFLN